jgi:hypothetical protein
MLIPVWRYFALDSSGSDQAIYMRERVPTAYHIRDSRRHRSCYLSAHVADCITEGQNGRVRTLQPADIQLRDSARSTFKPK